VCNHDLNAVARQECAECRLSSRDRYGVTVWTSSVAPSNGGNRAVDVAPDTSRVLQRRRRRADERVPAQLFAERVLPDAPADRASFLSRRPLLCDLESHPYVKSALDEKIVGELYEHLHACQKCIALAIM
jgi:hypothetical protein